MKRAIVFLLLVSALAATVVLAQQPLAPQAPPLFFREVWKQTGKEHGIDAEAVTNPNLELKVFDPFAKFVSDYAKNPPPLTRADNWTGPNCLQISGTGKSETSPANLWSGVCQGPVAMTLRDKNNYVNLTGLAKIRWISRVAGFHSVRPVIRLADGTYLVGDHTDGEQSLNSNVFLETEFAVSAVRWIQLDTSRVTTRGNWVEHPDLSKVDEVGYADLMPGSGHGLGGYSGVAKIEVYGTPVKR